MLEKALNYVLKALFRDTAIAHLCCHLAESTWHQVLAPGTRHITKTWQVGYP